MNIKLLIHVSNGGVVSLDIPQELWVESNTEAHWRIHDLINQAMEAEREKINAEQEAA